MSHFEAEILEFTDPDSQYDDAYELLKEFEQLLDD